MSGIPFGTRDRAEVKVTDHPGISGKVFWRTRRFGDVRARMVEYTPGYPADNWCVKGHILFCLEGELHTELEDGRRFMLKAGISYQVADKAEPHLFIVD
jgi:quercetin dioxygenase-like cupin family protein